MVVGATSLPQRVDTAFLCHFNFRIHVTLPSKDARAKILKLALKDENHTLSEDDIDDLAKSELCHGCSGDDIGKTVDNLVTGYSIAIIETNHFERVSPDTLLSHLEFSDRPIANFQRPADHHPNQRRQPRS